MRKGTLTLILAVAGLIVAPLVFAGQRGARGAHLERGHFGSGMFLGHLLKAREELNLNDAQTGELKAIFRALHEENATYRQQLRGGFDAVTRALLANPNDLAAAQALIDQQAAAERAMKMNLLNASSKALNVLTTEQRARLGEMIAERQARRD